ncbi:Protein of unknown function [Carnobacterium alterfunditum]|uniref:YetF C-terminal domain-containing protein n=1 Tax=Carnobacterium alterfunditum TaxID=28230 RepID=A0A1N6GYG3_9LACT|nr:YetF domain-containing protein [Carnobacterium alterfunditum]SIO12584.1 Protein of unknown function [Carnobacterium alterfunditum]
MSDFLINIQTEMGTPNLLFDSWTPVIRIFFSTIITFILLLASLRIFGNRSVSNMSIQDVITSFTIGSTVSSTMILKDVTIINGFLAITLLLSMQFLVSKIISKWSYFSKFINPAPKVLFLKGAFLENTMKKSRVTKEDIYSAIRIQARCSSDKVFAVVLESNGNLSVVTEVSPDYEEEILKYLD